MRFPGFDTSPVLPKARRLHAALPLAMMAVLYWTSSIPGTPSSDDAGVYTVVLWTPPSVQNALHLPAYALLAATWRWALSSWLRAASTRTIAAFAIAMLYGALDEWHQSFVPGRFASLTDMALNFAGAALGAWLAARASNQST